MFNLMVSYLPESWDTTPYKCDRKRFLEYTEQHIKEQFQTLNLETLNKLMSFPTLFAIEGEERDSKIGYIKKLKVRSDHILVDFKFDPVLPTLPQGTLAKMETKFDIPQFERHRTHWAIKDEDLFEELRQEGFLTQDQIQASQLLRQQENQNLNKFVPNTIDSLNNDHVFIVHGRDNEVKGEVTRFIRELGLTPIILHEQASQGRTIIEKIEAYSNVGFAIVLYTPCDVGSNKDDAETNLQLRARQNVVMEHGYLMAKLGRSRVTALVKGDIETPNDISGVVYITYDSDSLWKSEVLRELRSAGVETE